MDFWSLAKGVVDFCCCYLVANSCLFCNPMDCSLPGSSVQGISQARILEWVAIAFSDLPLGLIKCSFSVLPVMALMWMVISRVCWGPLVEYDSLMSRLIHPTAIETPSPVYYEDETPPPLPPLLQVSITTSWAPTSCQPLFYLLFICYLNEMIYVKCLSDLLVYNKRSLNSCCH